MQLEVAMGNNFISYCGNKRITLNRRYFDLIFLDDDPQIWKQA